MKKRTKHNRKSAKNQSKMDLLRGLGGLLEGFCRLPGPSGSEFESQDGSKLDLGGFLGKSGRLLGPSRDQTEGQNGAKLGP